ncbi:MAG: hypothetical protein HC858_13035 [Brachymonas sp.]|nr:hypothetical protein [Brachymonas sp.]
MPRDCVNPPGQFLPSMYWKEVDCAKAALGASQLAAARVIAARVSF